jgi:hypothetical protein
VITAVLGTQQDRIDAQLHRTPTSSRPRTTATRIGIPKSRINRADLIYEHLKGREDEVIGRITRLLRTSRPIRRLAVDPWPGPVMQARIASRSLVVVAPLEHVDSQNKEQQCRPSVSEVVHRIGASHSHAGQRRTRPNRTTPVQFIRLPEHPAVPAARRFCSCPEYGSYQDQQRNGHGQCCAASAKGHTGPRTPPCRSRRSDPFFISKRLGSAMPSTAFGCFGRGVLVHRQCSLLSVHSMLAILRCETNHRDSAVAVGGAALRGKCVLRKERRRFSKQRPASRPGGSEHFRRSVPFHSVAASSCWT